MEDSSQKAYAIGAGLFLAITIFFFIGRALFS